MSPYFLSFLAPLIPSWSSQSPTQEREVPCALGTCFTVLLNEEDSPHWWLIFRQGILVQTSNLKGADRTYDAENELPPGRNEI